ncbi:MAG TPA: site-specific integrase [Acidimicrobiales bacterium]|nr:site-specific integrase [Acidimicrobiales bacterium]
MATKTPAKPKRRRRPRTFGAITKMRSGRFQASYIDPDTRRRELGPHTFDTVDDADTWLSLRRADITRKTLERPDPSPADLPTFREYAASWLKDGVEDGHIRQSTQAKYQGLLNRHLLPIFGDISLNAITREDVRAWHKALKAQHLSTAANAYRLLNSIFRAATDGTNGHRPIVAVSPCQVHGGGREDPKEPTTITQAQFETAVAAMPERCRLAIYLALWGQMRRGEFLALQRRDVNLKTGAVMIERAWVAPEGKRPVIGPPKTQRSKRRVYLASDDVKVLKAHLKRFVGPKPADWLFPGVTDASLPILPRTFFDYWHAAREAAGCPDVKIHGLRHTGLTWFFQSGAAPAEVARRGGQTVRAAERYWHATDDRDRELAAKARRRKAN